jgi:hypothetical protein
MKSTRPLAGSLAKTGSDIERLLLAAGTEDRPDEETVRRAAAVLGIAPRAALIAAVTGTVAAALRANRWTTAATWVSVGAIGLAGVAGFALVKGAAHRANSAPRTAMVMSAAAARAVADAIPTAPALPLQTGDGPTTPAPPLETRALVSAPVPAPVSATTNGTATEAHGLREQAGLLDRARALLAAGDARGALARLGEFDRRFAGGPLREEALLLRIEALDRAGDRGPAGALARRFLKAYPGSVQADRVASIARQMQEDPTP